MKKLAAAFLFMAVFFALSTVTAFAANDKLIYKNDKAVVDANSVTDGYVRVAYTGGGTNRVKVLVTNSANKQYQYNLNIDGNYESFPMSEGNGGYTVDVYTNVTESRYARAFTTKLDVSLKSEFAPFLNSNQYVNYSATNEAVKKASELTKDAETKLDIIKEIYSYIVNNVTYDKEKAKTVRSGYLPNVDDTLTTGKGICFDYASLMSAMLRSKEVPCRLVTGLAGEANHAWIDVYTEETGWINGAIKFDGKVWKLMDPTFASSAKESKKIMQYIGDGENYTPKFWY